MNLPYLKVLITGNQVINQLAASIREGYVGFTLCSYASVNQWSSECVITEEGIIELLYPGQANGFQCTKHMCYPGMSHDQNYYIGGDPVRVNKEYFINTANDINNLIKENRQMKLLINDTIEEVYALQVTPFDDSVSGILKLPCIDYIDQGGVTRNVPWNTTTFFVTNPDLLVSESVPPGMLYQESMLA